MILIFGGTTEGKQAIEVLEALQCPFVYSTKTKVAVSDSVDYRFGALNDKSMGQLIEDRKIKLIINCAHPFATVLHETIDQVATSHAIDVIRLEREFVARMDHHLVQYVNDYEDALDALKPYVGKSLLALSGVQSIPKLKAFWATSLTYFRILDRDESRAIANDSLFPIDQLILGLSDGTLTSEIDTIKQKDIQVILTKESGESGGLSTKIKAALECNIPIIILKKPDLPKDFQLVYSVQELKTQLGSYVSLKEDVKV